MCVYGSVCVCVGGGARQLRMRPMTKPDVKMCAFTRVCAVGCVIGSDLLPSLPH